MKVGETKSPEKRGFKKGLFSQIVICLCVLFSSNVLGNNVRFNGKPVVNINADTIMISFSLSWDNSWRDEFNWDAVWIFGKFSKGLTDVWHHLKLQPTGHTMPDGFTCEVGNIDGTSAGGLFVMRDRQNSGNVESKRFTIKTIRANMGNITSYDVEKENFFVSLSAIEMVYIPYGSYDLGDDYSAGSWRSIRTMPIPEHSDIIGTDSKYEYYSSSSTKSGTTYDALAKYAADRVNNPKWASPYKNIWYIPTANGGGKNNSWIVDFNEEKTIQTFGVSFSTYVSSSLYYIPDGNWYLLGSRDSLSWDTLSICSKEDAVYPAVSYPVQSRILVEHPGSYRWYRLFFPSSRNGTTSPMISNVAMSEEVLYPNEINSYLVDSEDAITYGKAISQLYSDDGKTYSGTLAATYPKGYKGFYCMKYEVSQDQYVSFLNTLTRVQQKARIGNNLDELKVGEYVFGDKSQPSYRNGICVLSNEADEPATFGCNLNPASPYFGEDDGKCIACNFLTYTDMLAYCDWACLRPLSELEYEKACRKPYPQAALKGEYAWNSASGVNRLTGKDALTGVGRVNEQPSSASVNVNYGNPDLGPVRCGSFGTSGTSQSQAGATFFGLMEMSGNVAELYYSILAKFNTSNILTSHGNGEIATAGTSDVATTIWPVAAGSFIAKGGSFASANAGQVAISERSRLDILDVRDSTVGFRAGRSIQVSDALVAGEISAPEYGCFSGTLISSAVNASYPGVNVFYKWYVKPPSSTTYQLIVGENGSKLTYEYLNLATTTVTLTFKRVATCALGEATSNEVAVKFLPQPFADYDTIFSNAVASLTVANNWEVSDLIEWKLQGAPNEVYVIPQEKQVIIAGGLYNDGFYLVGSVKGCPNDLFFKPVQINNEFAYTGKVDSVTLYAGTYLIECYGGSGGGNRSNGTLSSARGLGGYAKGEIQFSQNIKLYIYVGGLGGNGTSSKTGGKAGWNGGAAGGGDEGDDTGGGGGGASDVRLELDSLKSRIMVAGGGGGTGSNGGGGLTGDGGVRAGTQNSGAAFGVGSAGTYGGSGYSGGGGGGGGYYGGIGGPRASSAGGGSGFVSGMAGCDAIDISGVHTGLPYHYSGLFFTDAEMQNDVQSGAGLIRITRLR